MQPNELTRAEIQDKLKQLTGSVRNHIAVKQLVKEWLDQKECAPFFQQQVLNDLTSYKEYLELVN